MLATEGAAVEHMHAHNVTLNDVLGCVCPCRQDAFSDLLCLPYLASGLWGCCTLQSRLQSIVHDARKENASCSHAHRSLLLNYAFCFAASNLQHMMHTRRMLRFLMPSNLRHVMRARRMLHFSHVLLHSFLQSAARDARKEYSELSSKGLAELKTFVKVRATKSSEYYRFVSDLRLFKG
eukprot:scaffold147320_cov19-Tisochrysis_lutea.AAC.1